MSKKSESMKGTYFVSSVSTTSFLVEYGISSIFVLFLLFVFDYSIPLTSEVYAYYYSFAFLLPILVGYISDKYLNKSISITIGFILTIISQIFLWFSASLYNPNNPATDTIVFNTPSILFIIGLLFLASGISFTSLASTHMINSINKESLRHKGFSIYYPVLNIGILAGVIITSVVVGNENYELYKWVFFIFTIILAAGLISFKIGKGRYLVDNDGNSMKDEYPANSISKKSNGFLKNISHKGMSKINNLNLKKKITLFHDSLTSHDRDKLKVFLIFIVVIIFYRIAYSQTDISMIFFIEIYVERDMTFFTVPVQMFRILNPFFILILGPIFIKIKGKLDKKGIELDFIKRAVLSLLVLVICYALMTVIGYYLDINCFEKISLIWIVVFEFFIAVSEILFSIAGYAMVGDLAPKKYYSLFFGFFLATKSIAMFISGTISEYFPPEDATNFIFSLPSNGLMRYFIVFVITNLIVALALMIYRKKIIEKMHPEDNNPA